MAEWTRIVQQRCQRSQSQALLSRACRVAGEQAALRPAPRVSVLRVSRPRCHSPRERPVGSNRHHCCSSLPAVQCHVTVATSSCGIIVLCVCVTGPKVRPVFVLHNPRSESSAFSRRPLIFCVERAVVARILGKAEPRKHWTPTLCVPRGCTLRVVPAVPTGALGTSVPAGSPSAVSLRCAPLATVSSCSVRPDSRFRHAKRRYAPPGCPPPADQHPTCSSPCCSGSRMGNGCCGRGTAAAFNGCDQPPQPAVTAHAATGPLTRAEPAVAPREWHGDVQLAADPRLQQRERPQVLRMDIAYAARDNGTQNTEGGGSGAKVGAGGRGGVGVAAGDGDQLGPQGSHGGARAADQENIPECGASCVPDLPPRETANAPLPRQGSHGGKQTASVEHVASPVTSLNLSRAWWARVCVHCEACVCSLRQLVHL